MKKVTAILCYVFMVSYSLSAQNYQTVYPDRIAYFSNAFGTIKCIRIDSVRVEKDSILFPFTNLYEISPDCYTPYGPSWIGEKVVMNESQNLFFNENHDIIIIKTDAILNENWLAYEMPDSTRIIATVIGFDTLSFFGWVDSVKTIGFQAYDQTMKRRNHVINDMTIKISKNYGCIKILNFIGFPEKNEYGLFDNPLMEYNLIGLSNPEVGVQNITWLEVFDFQPGDELHVLYNSYCWEPEHGSNSVTEKTITKYLSRTDYPDSILYETLIQSMEHYSWNDQETFRYRYDTIKTVIRSNLLFDKLPGEPIIDYDDCAYANSMVNSNPLIKSVPSIEEQIHVGFDSCWILPIADGCFSSENYYKGLGGPYFSCFESFMCTGETNNELVYYKKGDKTWGTPLVISDIQDVNNSTIIEVYPNPAKECINIKTSSVCLPFLFELMDLNGKTLLQQNINTEISVIILDKNLKGIYLYRIIDGSKTVRYGKLLVE